MDDEYEELDFTSMLKLFEKIPKDKFRFCDLIENLKDFEDDEKYSSNKYF
jgi:hypothetical protein